MNLYGLGSSHHLPVSVPNRSGQAADIAQARVATIAKSTETSGALSITTEDGDRVTLSYSALQAMAAASVSVADGNTSADGVSASSLRSASVSLSVDGQLDKQETSDITKLFKRFFHAVQDLFRGAPEKAAARLAKGGGLDSLSGFSFSLQQQSVAAAAQASCQASSAAPQVAGAE